MNPSLLIEAAQSIALAEDTKALEKTIPGSYQWLPAERFALVRALQRRWFELSGLRLSHELADSIVMRRRT